MLQKLLKRSEYPDVFTEVDRTSLMAMHSWSQTGLPPARALQYRVAKESGGYETAYWTTYRYGLCFEFAGLVEHTVEKFSVRLNYRYINVNRGSGPEFCVGDRLDTGGLFIQHFGTLRSDGQGGYVTDPETGQPYLDDKYVEISPRTFRSDETGGLAHGDFRFVVRGMGEKFQFRLGPRGSEQIAFEVDKDGIYFNATTNPANRVNIITALAALDARVTALEP